MDSDKTSQEEAASPKCCEPPLEPCRLGTLSFQRNQHLVSEPNAFLANNFRNEMVEGGRIRTYLP